jgi:transcriptional regulator with XRE-family HTH domain
MSAIHLRIYDLRKAKQMSQKELADEVGVSVHEPAIIRLNQEKPTKSRVCTDSVLFI